MTDSNDNFLVGKVLCVDNLTFEKLYIKYRSKVKHIVAQILCDPHDIEDVIQIVFIKAFQEIIPSRSDLNFPSWLFVIAADRARKFHDEKYGDNIRFLDAKELYKASHEINNINYLDNPEEKYIAMQTNLKIERAFMALPATLRLTFCLREIECLSYEEISKKIARPIGTVRSRIFRAREEMWEEINKSS
ncbi:sigma-70 family RNA polymerase sigma factor [Janthinobacterium sp. DSP2-3-3]|uniref:sigma-70 family RNA polymerase sigma factor n=1 Tax=Janthinobacterium sp. DSP2-3-3 TaxID=2804596 RepID=UPI003CEFADF0